MRPLLVALLLLGACQRPAPEEPDRHPVRVTPPAPPERCEVTVEPAADPPRATGMARADTVDEAEAAAWAVACAKLLDDDAPCDAEHLVVAQRKTTVSFVNGVSQAEHEITVHRPRPRVSAAADSDVSHEAACRKAERAACRAAGVDAGCVATGAWRPVR